MTKSIAAVICWALLAAVAFASGSVSGALLCAGNQQQAPAQSSQPAAGHSPSVAEAARRARAARSNAPHAKKVYTNDDLPSDSGISIVGTSGSRPEGAAHNAPAGSNSPSVPAGSAEPGSANGKTVEARGEKYWRDRFGKARAKLREAQDDLAALQKEKSKLDLQYYPNPQETLIQSVTRSDITAAANRITAKQEEVRQLQQGLADLEDELRKAGGEPGWARE